MRTVNASITAAIAAGTLKVAELFIFTLADGTVHRFTSHPEDITWDAGGNTYEAAPIGRGAISYSSNFESDHVQVALANISGDFYNLVQNNILEACRVTIKRILWDDSYAADKEITVFAGFADIEFNRQVLSFDCRPVADLLNIKVPRHLYEEPCNHRLYDVSCGLRQADFAYSGTATGGSNATLIDATRGTVYKINFDAGDSSNAIVVGDTVTGQGGAGTGVVVGVVYLTATSGTLWYVEQSGVQFVDDEELRPAGGAAYAVDVNGTPAEDTEFYEIGEVEMTGGDCSGCRRPVLSNSVSTVTLLWPFPQAISNGDTYEIFPGCDKRAVTCRSRFNNETNFRGFLYVPKIEETIY
jgi:hypothetical protein